MQKAIREFLIEFGRNDFGRGTLPPIRFLRAVMKSDATESSRVGEDKRAIALKKNEVIVLGWPIIRRLDADLTGHAQVNSEPVLP